MPYLYNGKELEGELGLGWMDYGARRYDAAIGRWGGVDPLAHLYYGWSSYNYVLGNPISFVDPDGRSVDTTRVFDLNGRHMFTIDDNVPNEEHFLSSSSIDRVASMCSDDPCDIAMEARSISEYYIGQTTKQDIRDIHKRSSAEGMERGFILHLGEGTRELQVIDVTDESSRSERHVNVGKGLTNLPEHIVPIIMGHTHLNTRFASGPEIGDWLDYAPNFDNIYTGRYGGHPAVVASFKHLHIFTTAQEITPKPLYYHPYHNYEYIGSHSRERGAGKNSPMLISY
jgi:RHS repeat-associated protein